MNEVGGYHSLLIPQLSYVATHLGSYHAPLLKPHARFGIIFPLKSGLLGYDLCEVVACRRHREHEYQRRLVVSHIGPTENRRCCGQLCVDNNPLL